MRIAGCNIGFVEYAILKIVVDRQRIYGLAINRVLAKLIEQKKYSDGASNTMLGRLEDRGLLSSEWGGEESRADGRRRYYMATEAGRELCSRLTVIIQKIVQPI